MKKTSILAIVLFLAGCVGTSSPSHFYQLQMTDARVEPVSSRRLDVGVEEAFVPKYLDRPQIVTVEAGSSELKMSEFYRWAEPLSSSFSRVLADDLSLYLPKSVVKYKTLSSENFTYTITFGGGNWNLTSGGRCTKTAVSPFATVPACLRRWATLTKTWPAARAP